MPFGKLVQMRRLTLIISVLFSLLLQSSVYAAIDLLDEGSSQAFVWNEDCVGTLVQCTASGADGTITVRAENSTTLPATCTIGDIYLDTDADTDGSPYICISADTWKEIDDDGAAGAGDSVTVNSTAVDTTANLLDGDIDWTLTDGGAGGPDDITATVGCSGCVDTTDIADDTLLEADLNVDEVVADNDILTFDTTGSNFSWQTPSELITAGTEIAWTGTTLNVTAHTSDEVGTLTTGDLCINDGSLVNCTVNTEAELETALDAIDVVTVTADDITSANLATAVSDEQGSGALVFATSPTLTTPTLGAATATTLDTGQGANELYDLPLAAGADADSTTVQSDSGMEIVSTGLTLLRGCADNEILKWDETQDDWNCEADGGATAWDDIGDPSTEGTIAFAALEQDITSTLDDATAGEEAVLEIINSDADVANDTVLFRLDYSADDADPNAKWLQMIGSGGGAEYEFAQDEFTVADGNLVDFGAIDPGGTAEGLILPQGTDVSAATAEGQLSWDTDDEALYLGAAGAEQLMLHRVVFCSSTDTDRTATFRMRMGGGGDKAATRPPYKFRITDLTANTENNIATGTWTVDLDGATCTETQPCECSITSSASSCEDQGAANCDHECAANSNVSFQFTAVSTPTSTGGSGACLGGYWLPE